MRLLGLIFSLVLVALPLQADSPRIAQLYELMQVATTVEVLRDEGFFFALESEGAMFGGTISGNWQAEISRVYNLGQLQEIVRAGFEDAMQGVDLEPLIAFYKSEKGRRVVDLELTARRAFLSPGVEESARAAWRKNADAGAHREAISAFIEVNDLIERNVVGAMNSNYWFLRALAVANPDLSEAQIISEVWAEEESLRADTSEWMHAFLTMAYAPLNAQEMQANLALWQTPPGRALNNALFISFDRMFERISRDLGAVAVQMILQREL